MDPSLRPVAATEPGTAVGGAQSGTHSGTHSGVCSGVDSVVRRAPAAGSTTAPTDGPSLLVTEDTTGSTGDVCTDGPGSSPTPGDPAASAHAAPLQRNTGADEPAGLVHLRQQLAPGQDLWVFGYASLIWRPEFEATETHRTRVQGWHRALKMWSRINRGTPERPGLVFALLPGGSCQGLVWRVPAAQAQDTLGRLWAREMPMTVYTPRWLPCPTPQGPVRALAFTLSRNHPSHTGTLDEATYREIFASASGRFGSTLDYARETLEALRRHGIEDRALAALLRLAQVPTD